MTARGEWGHWYEDGAPVVGWMPFDERQSAACRVRVASDRDGAMLRDILNAMDVAPMPSPLLRTADEWLALKHPGKTIMDPDGWRDPDAPPWGKPLTEEEFDQRFARCTVRGR